MVPTKTSTYFWFFFTILVGLVYGNVVFSQIAEITPLIIFGFVFDVAVTVFAWWMLWQIFKWFAGKDEKKDDVSGDIYEKFREDEYMTQERENANT